MVNDHPTENQDGRQTVLHLLEKHKLLGDFVHKQDMPRHDLVESLVRKQSLAKLQQALNQVAPADVASVLEALPPDDQLFVWDQLNDERKELVLLDVPIHIIQALGKREYRTERSSLKAFELHDGRMREIPINTREDLLKSKLVWIDMVGPTFEERTWVGGVFGIELPDPDKLNDLESSARFYVEENGEVHLHSDFLLDKEDVSRNVAVAFILYKNILFTVRKEELPVFRLQRLRALTQPNYVSDSWDVLLDLYAADVEYSADALEDVYRGLEIAGKQVLSKQMTDEDAARMLSNIAHEEDLNGRIRRNVLDTRRAVSFLMRSKFLAKYQLDDAQQILRDIESLDGHTSFLFGKINFLMDATVGFININQNKVIKRLTVISVIFMPLNILAGVGGMSEYSMMTHDALSWPVAYGLFFVGLVCVGWITYLFLQFLENREKIGQLQDKN
ncbi:MAG: magnesium transporter CorA [Nitrosomonadales bacterium]|nr:magnesium transporter CorA [Nitrosomonadales bacterium]